LFDAMESLALAAAVIVLVNVALPVLACGVSLAGWRTAGAVVGVVALVALGGFAWVAPQAWTFWGPLGLAALWAVGKRLA